MKLCFRGRTWEASRSAITAVLNVTPDSYYAPSRVQTTDTLLEQAKIFLQEGADFLEVGGESTGPMSKDVSEEEELRRVVPAVRAIRKNFPDAWIVVDTWKAVVAQAALDAGADILNDITAGRGDPDYFAVAAAADCPIILMFSKDDTPRTTVARRAYNDVVSTVCDFLEQRIRLAEKAGVRPDAILVDPGLGHFVSSDPAYSYELLDHLDALAKLAPVLVSPSRKSFLAGPENTLPSDRLAATLAASALAVCRGASCIRTHDVGATKKALQSLHDLLHQIPTQK